VLAFKDQNWTRCH